MMNSFDAVSKLLNYREFNILSNKQKMDLFFIDIELQPLLIYEN